MAKEIGGYMELEPFTGEEYYPDLYKVNLGRTALIHLIRILGCRRIFIPRYICSSVIHAARRTDCEVILYEIDGDLQPLLSPEDLPGEHDWLYLVNYYEQLSPEEIGAVNDRFRGRVILDNAQAFYQHPIDGVPCIYTCRKFFGLSDGAYIYAPGTREETLPVDRSAGRMSHILGRLEDSAREHYSEMLAVNDTFESMPVLRMSRLTENLLRGIDYESVRRKRRENYALLAKLLPSDNPFTRRTPAVPFAYPFFHPDGIRLRKALAQQNIFVPTNWSYLLETMPQDSPEYQWSANILPLPVDQRCGESEMTVIAEAIRAYR